MAPMSTATVAEAFGTRPPWRAASTYRGTMPTPCESWPLRLASTRFAATWSASCGVLPAPTRMPATTARRSAAEMGRRIEPGITSRYRVATARTRSGRTSATRAGPPARIPCALQARVCVDPCQRRNSENVGERNGLVAGRRVARTGNPTPTRCPNRILCRGEEVQRIAARIFDADTSPDAAPERNGLTQGRRHPCGRICRRSTGLGVERSLQRSCASPRKLKFRRSALNA